MRPKPHQYCHWRELTPAAIDESLHLFMRATCKAGPSFTAPNYAR
jgi:hypothetical protein